MTEPLKIKSDDVSHLRIKSVHPHPTLKPKGQDTHVVLVMKDGSEVPVPGVKWLHYRVDSRGDFCTAVFEAFGVELVSDAQLGSREEQLQRENEALRRRLDKYESQVHRV